MHHVVSDGLSYACQLAIGKTVSHEILISLCLDLTFSLSRNLDFTLFVVIDHTQVVNQDVPHLKTFKFSGSRIKLILSADTKALWSVLGMGSNGTYPCPFCEIDKLSMQSPRHGRHPSKPRTFQDIMAYFNENMR